VFFIIRNHSLHPLSCVERDPDFRNNLFHGANIIMDPNNIFFCPKIRLKRIQSVFHNKHEPDIFLRIAPIQILQSGMRDEIAILHFLSFDSLRDDSLSNEDKDRGLQFPFSDGRGKDCLCLVYPDHLMCHQGH
jgi:hypothetical protein